MQEKFVKFIEQEKLIDPGDRILLGVSGGADSLCLLFLLNEIKEKYDLDLHILHLHHGIRGKEADRDADFVADLARKLGLPFCLVKEDVPAYAKKEGLTEEEAGRILRYRAFETYGEEHDCDKIALAHHRDDQAETLLFHLFRGTGPHGMAGMPLKRGKIIRPLLFASRSEIEEFMEERGLAFCQDSTNEDTAYSRNIIRLEILPLAKDKINPQVAKHLTDFGRMQGAWGAYIEKQGKKALDTMAHWQKEGVSLDRKSLGLEDPVIQEEILRQVFLELVEGAKDLTQTHYHMALSLLASQTGKRIDLPGGIFGESRYDSLYFGRRQGGENEGIFLPLTPEKELKFPWKNRFFSLKSQVVDRDFIGQQIPQRDYTKYLDYDMIKGELVLRNPREKDYFSMDREGHKKKLSRYMIDQHIPQSERGQVVVLAEGDHVLWVLSGRISEHYKVTQETRRVLLLQLEEDHCERGNSY
ncbi:MAG: tRNA lysidine(34) synthetase TilS [Eubacterium sp.]|nr:tRNA lysidine(34) synthetase TilS [Eubacterium sp.]